MPDPPILGPDGRPLVTSPLGPRRPKQVSPQEYCALVLDSYINDTMKAGVNPIDALAEMGTQVPIAMVELVRQSTKGDIAQAKEPMEFLLKRIAAVCWQMGFRLYFSFDHKGDQKDEDGGKETNGEKQDSGGKIQRNSDQENTERSEGLGGADDANGSKV